MADRIHERDPGSETPLIEFIDGDPPAQVRKGEHVEQAGYVLGVLAGQPSRWAVVDYAEAPASLQANRLRAKAEALGIQCEAVSRGGKAYARVIT